MPKYYSVLLTKLGRVNDALQRAATGDCVTLAAIQDWVFHRLPTAR